MKKIIILLIFSINTFICASSGQRGYGTPPNYPQIVLALATAVLDAHDKLPRWARRFAAKRAAAYVRQVNPTNMERSAVVNGADSRDPYGVVAFVKALL